MKQITKDQLVEVISESGDGAGRGEIAANVDFADIPMDSLDIMAAFQAVEDACGASIPDEVMHELKNLEDLVRHLKGQGVDVS